jgi:hypothetical protein
MSLREWRSNSFLPKAVSETFHTAQSLWHYVLLVVRSMTVVTLASWFVPGGFHRRRNMPPSWGGGEVAIVWNLQCQWHWQRASLLLLDHPSGWVPAEAEPGMGHVRGSHTWPGQSWLIVLQFFHLGFVLNKEQGGRWVDEYLRGTWPTSWDLLFFVLPVKKIWSLTDKTFF